MKPLERLARALTASPIIVAANIGTGFDFYADLLSVLAF
jgi:hypothetical protein